MKLKPYSKYKDSGIEWIGEIPEEWENFKLKYLIRSLESGKRENDEIIIYDKVFSLGGEHINWNGTLNLKNKRFISNEFYNSMSKGKVFLNDTLLVKDGATIGKTAFINEMPYEKIAVNEHVFIIRSNNLLIPKLLYYLISSDLGLKQIKLTETGSAQGGINSEIQSKVIFPICSNINNQKQIANFLDEKTRTIDKIIAKNEKLIELLEEKKTSLINHVVTKGLDPNAKMKDSGVEWIGEIPEDWNVLKLKQLTTKKAQYGANEEPEQDKNKFDCRYVRITDIDDNGKLRENSIAFLSEYNSRGFILNKGDVLFARSGATVGKVYLHDSNDGKYCFAGYMIRYIVNPELLNPKFLFYFSFSKSYKEWIKYISTQSTIENVAADKYDEMKITMPQIDYQQKIVNYLDKKISFSDQIISRLNKNIGLLEEYKKSLIYNFSTGKFKVY